MVLSLEMLSSLCLGTGGDHDGQTVCPQLPPVIICFH